MRSGIFVFFLPLFLAAQQPAFYVWQRKHSSQVKSAVIELQKYTESRLYFLAGELENSDKITQISPPDYIIPARTVPVIRIHIRHLQDAPEKLAQKVLKLYEPWKKCHALQIDLDAPESKIKYYMELMQALRRKLPRTELSATVLPCHLKHTGEFIKFAYSCDFYVLQIHGLEKRGSTLSLIDRKSVVSALNHAFRFRRPFKLALPFYSYNLSDLVVKPDMLLVGNIIRFAKQRNIGIIIFRLGIDGDGESLSAKTALAFCKSGEYRPQIRHSWERAANGAWHLYIHNDGFFSERATLELQWKRGFTVYDTDTFNDAKLAFDRKTMTLTLPPDQQKKLCLWLRTPAKFAPENSPLTITRKENTRK